MIIISSSLFSLKLYTLTELTSYKEVIIDPNWKLVISNEIQSLTDSNTWLLTTFPHNKIGICCKWVFKLIFLAIGSIERCKARLVGKGYNQTEGLDYHKSFSPLIKMITVRLILSIVASKN